MNNLHAFEEKLKNTIAGVLSEVKVSNLSGLNEAALMKLHKGPLSNIIISLVNVFGENVSTCKSAAEKIDELKSEQIKLQQRLISLQDNQIDSVRTTVKSELSTGLKSWSEVVKKNTTQVQNSFVTSTKESVKQVLKKVSEEERRSANLMIYGLPERDGENIVKSVEEIYGSMNVQAPKEAIDCYRIGKKEDGKVRPIRLECQTRMEVDFALVHSRKLKYSAKHAEVYLAPDRTKEQRLEHSLLVKKMKDLISKDATKHYFIRNNKVCSADCVRP